MHSRGTCWRRLLALALVLERHGMDRQTLRDRVIRYKEHASLASRTFQSAARPKLSMHLRGDCMRLLYRVERTSRRARTYPID